MFWQAVSARLMVSNSILLYLYCEFCQHIAVYQQPYMVHSWGICKWQWNLHWPHWCTVQPVRSEHYCRVWLLWWLHFMEPTEMCHGRPQWEAGSAWAGASDNQSSQDLFILWWTLVPSGTIHWWVQECCVIETANLALSACLNNHALFTSIHTQSAHWQCLAVPLWCMALAHECMVSVIMHYTIMQSLVAPLWCMALVPKVVNSWVVPTLSHHL